MAKFICFANQKGGVGKTTLTMLCANALSNPPFNKSVCVVDADVQQSYSQARYIDTQLTAELPYPVRSMNTQQIEQAIETLEEYDFVFLDTQGKIDEASQLRHQENAKILLLSDIVFVPITQGNFGVDASVNFLKHVNSLRKLKPSLQVFGVVNMFQSRTKDGTSLLEELAIVSATFGIPILKKQLNHLTIYRNVDTINSLYSKDNFKSFFDEFYHVIK